MKNSARLAVRPLPATDASYHDLRQRGAQFSCTVSNSAGSMTSNAASLTVNAALFAPSITSQPVSRTVTAGQAASFTVGVSGTAPFTLPVDEERRGDFRATSSSYTTPTATSSDKRRAVRRHRQHASASITSGAATLTVNAGTLLLSSNTAA